jgi:hypothetical protein
MELGALLAYIVRPLAVRARSDEALTKMALYPGPQYLLYGPSGRDRLAEWLGRVRSARLVLSVAGRAGGQGAHEEEGAA